MQVCMFLCSFCFCFAVGVTAFVCLFVSCCCLFVVIVDFSLIDFSFGALNQPARELIRAQNL